jgi:tripartite-type tricarboxylate transporter receptor subunit TctC
MRFPALNGLIALVLMTLSAAPLMAQQAWPTKPIRFITPFAAGGSTSVLARIVGQKFTEAWGQQVLVDNRPGGNTLIGAEALSRSPADGYTLMLAPINHALNPLLIPNWPFDPVKDFTNISTLGRSEYALALNPGVPANNLQEFIAYARARPGELNYASPASGGPGHLAGELFNIRAGVKLTHVPYKGAAPAINDLVGGQVQLSFVVPLNVVSLVKAGKLRAIAISGPKRMSALPQMPTFTEAGLANFEPTIWFGVIGPAGLPRAIVDRLNAEIVRMLALAETRETLDAQGMEAFSSSPAQFDALIRSDQVKFAQVIKAANIKIDN